MFMLDEIIGVFYSVVWIFLVNVFSLFMFFMLCVWNFRFSFLFLGMMWKWIWKMVWLVVGLLSWVINILLVLVVVFIVFVIFWVDLIRCLVILGDKFRIFFVGFLGMINVWFFVWGIIFIKDKVWLFLKILI